MRDWGFFFLSPASLALHAGAPPRQVVFLSRAILFVPSRGLVMMTFVVTHFTVHKVCMYVCTWTGRCRKGNGQTLHLKGRRARKNTKTSIWHLDVELDTTAFEPFVYNSVSAFSLGFVAHFHKPRAGSGDGPDKKVVRLLNPACARISPSGPSG